MAKTTDHKRKRVNEDQYELNPPPFAPRKKGCILDTPRQTALLRDGELTAGKITRKKLLKRHNVSKGEFTMSLNLAVLIAKNDT